jgi:thiamine biosynthesis lipoprotein
MPASQTFPALGSLATVAVTQPDALDAACAATQEVVDAFDRACSRFRTDSELSAVNRASGAPVHVSPLFIECCGAAVRAAQLTDGDVDPTVGEALVALGYDRDHSELSHDGADSRAVSIASVPGWRTVRLDPHAGSVAVARGVSLDFGATAKALAADRAADASSERVGCGVLVSLGGDLALAGLPPEEGWLVRVTDDHRAGPSAPGQWVRVKSGGLATSSTTTRRWEMADGPRHHLIDPATGRSADSPWRTVSVAAASCLDANIASTAAIVRGEEAGSWLVAQELPSRLVTQAGGVLHLAGWTDQGDDLSRMVGAA